MSDGNYEDVTVYGLDEDVEDASCSSRTTSARSSGRTRRAGRSA